jgi:hypothetical protein
LMTWPGATLLRLLGLKSSCDGMLSEERARALPWTTDPSSPPSRLRVRVKDAGSSCTSDEI